MILKKHSSIDKLPRFLFQFKWLSMKVDAEQVRHSQLLRQTVHPHPFGLPF